tara:strand:+ start:36 stop:209 length:174 start_codon:yes stop_codon:yes gene_type:complete
MTKYNIIIRPTNTIKDYCSGEVKTHTLEPEQIKKLYKYVNKNFRFNWQEVKPDKECN